MKANHNVLTGRTAVVTGASSGIGRAIASELAASGADVVVHARRNLRGAEEVAQRIAELGRAAKVLTYDLADAAGAIGFVDTVWQWHGGVDIWINNAGADVLTGEAAAWDFEQKLDTLWKVDVAGTVRLSRIVGQRMKAAGQETARYALLNMGWDQAQRGMAGDSGEMFATIKSAVMAFTRSLAKSLAPQVRVNCLAPGWIKTAWGHDASEYWQQRACGESLLGRWGTPEDVAKVARFLVSPDAEFINGQIIAINGGWPE
jgi:3-oxoacyl-[acyl-carrier protein] reductase